MKYLLSVLLLFSFSFAKYDVLYNDIKLGEIQNIKTIKENYIQIDVTSKMAKFFFSKDKFIIHNDHFDKNSKNENRVKYKKDKYQVLNIIQLTSAQNIKYEKFNISKGKYIELWFDEKYYFRYTSKNKLKSEGYLVVKDHVLQSLVDTRNNIKIILN